MFEKGMEKMGFMSDYRKDIMKERIIIMKSPSPLSLIFVTYDPDGIKY